MPCGLLAVLLLSIYVLSGCIYGTYLLCRSDSDSFKMKLPSSLANGSLSRGRDDRRQRARDSLAASVLPAGSLHRRTTPKNASLHRRSNTSLESVAIEATRPPTQALKAAAVRDGARRQPAGSDDAVLAQSLHRRSTTSESRRDLDASDRRVSLTGISQVYI